MNLSQEAKVIQHLFSIQNKSGVKVPFLPNQAQQFLDTHDPITERARILIAKCRQKGFSSFIGAKFSVRCLGREGTHAVVLSHEANATQRLLDKSHYYLKHINGPKPIFGRNSRGELYFPKTESTYYIGTAGSKTFGRGDWITDLHCSEYAWWDDPVKHTAGLFQAVPQNGRIYIESTGNGRNNDFYYMWDNAEAMGYHRIFYPWWVDDEYEIDMEKEWKSDLPKHNAYLYEIKEKFKLNDRKMAWYEQKLKEMREDLKLMQQEYPSEPEECFQATGGAIFPEVSLTPERAWQATKTLGYYTYGHRSHPHPGFNYVLGADPSGGTGHDDSALNVFCVETNEQALEFFYNTVDPITFAKLLCEVGKLYNTAYIVCESNNHGAAVIPYLKENYPRDRIYKRKLGTKHSPPLYGWHNTDINKHALIGTMQEHLDEIRLYGTQTVKELKGFEETAEKKMQGKSDNLVIATGLAMLGLKKFEYLRRDFLTPKVEVKREKPNYMTYKLDDILNDIEKRRKGPGLFGIQVGQGYPSA